MKLWIGDTGSLPSVEQCLRTAIAATASLLLARLIEVPEAYWASIATLVVMQSTLGSTLTLSIGRIVAAALGAFLGALETTCFGTNLLAFTAAIFLLGLCSLALRLEKTACRYASITLTVIVLVPHTGSPWLTALHRFIEVSIGVVVALIVIGVWPDRERTPEPRLEVAPSRDETSVADER